MLLESLKKYKALIFFDFCVRFLMPCVGAYVFEQSLEHFLKSETVAKSPFNQNWVYGKLMAAAGIREIKQDKTVIVDLIPDDDYKKVVKDIGGVCGESGVRSGMAVLLEKISQHKPSVIVLDHSIKDSCRDEDLGTRRLKAALENVSKQIPVVIGRSAQQPETLIQSGSNYKGVNPVLAPTEPALDFGEPLPGIKIIEGLVNVNVENRKFAPCFEVLRTEKSKKIERIPTLAYAAVSVYENNILEPTHCDDIYNISFIEPSKFDYLSAGKLMLEELPKGSSKLTGKIVIIGKVQGTSDMHAGVYGNNPGVMYHANYIEAKLDQRTYNSFPWLNYLIGFIFFLAVNYSGYKINSAWKLSLVLAVIFVVFILLLLLPIHLLRVYIDPITVSILAVIITIAHKFFPSSHHQTSNEH
jgi:CHASE2 domain-containing sensor protein